MILWGGRGTELGRMMTTLNEHWSGLGRSGMLGVGLPSRFGGQGGGPAEVWRTARRVGRDGFDLGVGLTWIVHHVVSRFQLGKYGTEDQKAAWLPRLASGESMAATAGGMPIALAEQDEDSLVAHQLPDGAFELHGTRTGVINAPMADLVVVFAHSPLPDAPGRLGTYLLHRDTPGLRFTPGTDRAWCPTSPVATAVFDHCTIPAANLLGTHAQAQEMFDLFGEQFDILALEVIAGFLNRLAEVVDPHMRRSDRARLSLLILRGRLQALQSLNRFLAEEWDARFDDPSGYAAAQAAARELIRRTREDLADLPDHPDILAAQRDLELMRLGWQQTRRRFLLAIRSDEVEGDPEPTS